jgi:hypothetical protein
MEKSGDKGMTSVRVVEERLEWVLVVIGGSTVLTTGVGLRIDQALL